MALKEEIDLIVHSAHRDPFAVLGAHIIKSAGKECVAIRAFLPEAAEVAAVDLQSHQAYPMKRVHKDGLFEAVVRDGTKVFPYRLRKVDRSGAKTEFVDPYSFMPILTDFDLYLMAEGTHHSQYEKLGAHEMRVEGIDGVFFAVWAPNAIRVSVIGDFNEWDGRRHMMRVRGSTGSGRSSCPDSGKGLHTNSR